MKFAYKRSFSEIKSGLESKGEQAGARGEERNKCCVHVYIIDKRHLHGVVTFSTILARAHTAQRALVMLLRAH
jgi:hypothetical protein